jgi:hypothetical protein
MTGINGTIPIDGGGTEPAPGTVNPETNNGGGGNTGLAGTRWRVSESSSYRNDIYGDVGTGTYEVVITFTASNFEVNTVQTLTFNSSAAALRWQAYGGDLDSITVSGSTATGKATQTGTYTVSGNIVTFVGLGNGTISGNTLNIEGLVFTKQ